MDFYINLVLNSIIIGSIYSTLALAFNFNLIFNRILNLAIGSIAVFSGYFFYYFFEVKELNFFIALTFSFILSLFLIIFIEYFLFRPFQAKKTSLLFLILTLALLVILNNTILLLFGESPKIISKLGSLQKNIFPQISLSWLEVFIILVFIFLSLILYFFINYTKKGLALRALADNDILTKILGINVKKLENISILISLKLSFVAGIMIASIFNLDPNLGTNFSIKAFIASVIGGTRSVFGAIIGAFILSLSENFSLIFFPSSYKDLFSFIILFIFLIFWPRGIMAKKVGL